MKTRVIISAALVAAIAGIFVMFVSGPLIASAADVKLDYDGGGVGN